jgi:hypothetical protein
MAPRSYGKQHNKNIINNTGPVKDSFPSNNITKEGCLESKDCSHRALMQVNKPNYFSQLSYSPDLAPRSVHFTLEAVFRQKHSDEEVKKTRRLKSGSEDWQLISTMYTYRN